MQQADTRLQYLYGGFFVSGVRLARRVEQGAFGLAGPVAGTPTCSIRLFFWRKNGGYLKSFINRRIIMTNALQQISFHNDAIFIVEHNGEPYVPVRPLCENMGLDWKTQYRKLMEKKERFSVVMMTTQLPGDQQRREVVCIHLKKVAAWLNSIEPNKVAPHLKDKVETYQIECDEVLWNYWTKGVGLPDRDLANKLVVGTSEYIKLQAELIAFQQEKIAKLELKSKYGLPVSAKEAEEIREAVSGGMSVARAAKKFGRAQSTIKAHTMAERAEKRAGDAERQLNLFTPKDNGGAK
jgi:hypothetical protein